MQCSTYGDALKAFHGNEFSQWSPPRSEDLSEKFAAGRIHLGQAVIRSPKPFKVSRESNFFCVGSCFAREVEDAIEVLGLKALTKACAMQMMNDNPALFQRVEGTAGRPTAFLNRYNTGSMADLMLSVKSNSTKNDLLYGNGAGQFYDYQFTRFLRCLAIEEAQERRAKIIEMYHEAAKGADVFIFTLGLSECFFDKDTNSYLNVTPDPRTARGHDIEFRFLNFMENLSCAEEVVRNVREINANAAIIFTVSPVPLDSTFSGYDIVVANNLAKSTLVAVANEIASTTDGCFYFPSYEIVTTSNVGQAWLWDKKHVSSAMVKHIMRVFIDQHIN